MVIEPKSNAIYVGATLQKAKGSDKESEKNTSSFVGSFGRKVLFLKGQQSELGANQKKKVETSQEGKEKMEHNNKIESAGPNASMNLFERSYLCCQHTYKTCNQKAIKIHHPTHSIKLQNK